MTYNELENLIEKGKVQEGTILWITDLRFGENGALCEFIRNIKPTKVVLTNNTHLPQNKTVKYSFYHFRALNKDGSISKSKIIAPFDRTGYRGYRGVSLNIFFNEEDCIHCYKNLCKARLADLDLHRTKILKKFKEIEDSIEKELL